MNIPLVISSGRCLVDPTYLISSPLINGKPGIQCYSKVAGAVMHLFGAACEVQGDDRTVYHLRKSDLQEWIASYGYQAHTAEQIKSALQSIVATARCNHWMTLGDKYRNESDTLSAIEAYSTALEYNPRIPQVFIARAVAYRKNAKYPQAIADCSAAINLSPKYDYAWALRGDSFRMIDDYEMAINDLLTAVKLNPENVFALASLAECYRCCDRQNEATDYLNKALSIAPSNPFALESLANTHLDIANKYCLIKNYDEALNFILRALNENPFSASSRATQDYIKTLRLRANQRIELKNYIKATDDLTSILQVLPGDKNTLLQRAACYQTIRFDNLAISDFEEALVANPTCPIVRSTYSKYCKSEALDRLERGDYIEAKRFFDLYLKINPNDAAACYEFGECLFQMRNYAQSLQFYTKAVMLNPNSYNSRIGHGNCAIQMGLFADALTSFEAAIKLDSTKTAGWRGAGEVSVYLKDHTKSIEYLKKAIALEPSNVELYYQRAVAYKEAKKFSEAVKDCDQALKIDPTLTHITILRDVAFQKTALPSKLWKIFGR